MRDCPDAPNRTCSRENMPSPPPMRWCRAGALDADVLGRLPLSRRIGIRPCLVVFSSRRGSSRLQIRF
eukprot:7718088-Pyramimonas_sp.AAC.1